MIVENLLRSPSPSLSLSVIAILAITDGAERSLWHGGSAMLAPKLIHAITSLQNTYYVHYYMV